MTDWSVARGERRKPDDAAVHRRKAIDILSDEQQQIKVLVEGNRSSYVGKLLAERDIQYITLSNDSYHPSSNNCSRGPFTPPLLSSKSPAKSAIDWNDFYPLEAIYKFLHDLETSFPSTCTVNVIGRSVEGRDIKVLKISNSDASNTGVWIDGAIHAREWISACVVTYIADHIARNFTKLPKNVTNKDWYFAPVLNPDGYYYTFHGDRMWRKNRARVGNVITGVDLNRNFSCNWGKNLGATAFEGCSNDANHGNYKGTEPFSEPETAALKDFILYSGTPFKIFLTFHSYSEVISFPWCFTPEPCADYVCLLEGAALMAKAIYETTGRMYKVGNFKDLMYLATGTSIDWSYGVARIPFSYLIELRSKQHKFLLPKEEIFDCCRENLSAMMALVEFVDKKKCLNCTVLTRKLR